MRPWLHDFQFYLSVAAWRGGAVPSPATDAELDALLARL